MTGVHGIWTLGQPRRPHDPTRPRRRLSSRGPHRHGPAAVCGRAHAHPRRLPGRDRAGGGRHRRGARHIPRRGDAADRGRRPRHPALPGMAARQSRPARVNRQAGRAHNQRQWPAAALAPRSGQRVRLPRGRPRRRPRARHPVPVSLPDTDRAGPRRRHAGDGEPAVERRRALSRRLCGQRHPLRAPRDAAGGVALWNCPRRRRDDRRGDALRHGRLRYAGGLAAVRGQVFPPDRPRARRARALPPQHGGRPRRSTRRHRSADRAAPKSRAPTLSALRARPFRSL